MKLKIKDQIALVLESNNNEIDFFRKFDDIYHKIQTKNIIVSLTDVQIQDSNFIEKILKISVSHEEGKHSFVIISPSSICDKLPENLIWVPTLKEAVDLIEMDEMQRDLEF